jgi:hypothetical protein
MGEHKEIELPVEGTICRIDVNSFLDGNTWFPCDDGDDYILGEEQVKWVNEEIIKKGWNPWKSAKK